MKKSFPAGPLITNGIALASLVSLYNLGLFDGPRLLSAARNLKIFFSGLFPPQMDILPSLLMAVWETIQISFAGTMLGFMISLPFAFLGTRTLFGRRVITLVRLFIGGIRTVPSILFGIIFVIAFGLGPTAGTLGVAFYTVGYLAKLFYESFEAVDREVIEAVRSTGCGRLQLFRFAILPETSNTIISQILFMFEYNIRASTIMGFVGAGGIGYYMFGYIQMLQYRHLMTTLIVTFFVIMIIDFISYKIRSTLTVPKK